MEISVVQIKIFKYSSFLALCVTKKWLQKLEVLA